MFRVLLVRHASFGGVNRVLAGRGGGVHLDDHGRAQADVLAAALAAEPLLAVCSSPRERAVETAAPIAARHGLEVQVDAAFDEIDFGDWTGRSIDSLANDATWRAFNTARSTTRVPGGERMPGVQARAVAGVLALRERHGGGSIAVVSHCDVVRSILAFALGMPLDHMLRFTVDPASVSTLLFGDDGVPHVHDINRSTGA